MATQAQSATNATPAGTVSLAAKRNEKRKTRREGRKKLLTKLRTDKEFAKTYFGAKSKRAGDKKSTFRKKKSRKK